MEDLKIPQGYQRVMPYLIVNNAQRFLGFMKTVFDAAEKMKVMRDEEKIMHAELQVGESTIMFADSSKELRTQTAGMFVYVSDADETYNKALAEGATSVMELSDQNY